MGVGGGGGGGGNGGGGGGGRTPGSRIPRSSLLPTAASSTKKAPPSSARLSSAKAMSSASKRLSAYGLLRTTKDERPLQDPVQRRILEGEIMQQMAEDDADFKYQEQNNPRNLLLTRESFRQMFEFLWRGMDQGYTLASSHMEQEVPDLLRALGYPYQIQASLLQTVGATHTRPRIIGMIHWLILCLKFAKEFDPLSLLNNPEDGELACQNLILEYFMIQARARPYFLDVEADVDVEVEDPDLWVEERIHGDECEIQQRQRILEAEVDTLKESLDLQHEEAVDEEALPAQLQNLRNEKASKETFVKKISDYIGSQEARVEAARKEAAEAEEELQAVLAQQAEATAMLKQQKISEEEAESLLRHYQQKREDWEKAEANLGALKAENNSLEDGLYILSREVKEEVAELVRELESTFKAYPTGLVSEEGLAALPLNLSPTNPNFQQRWREELRPALADLRKELSRAQQRILQSILAGETRQRRLHSETETKEAKASELRRMMESLGREEGRLADLRRLALEGAESEAEAKAAKLKSLEEADSLNLAEQNRLLAELREERDALEPKLNRELEAAIVEANKTTQAFAKFFSEAWGSIESQVAHLEEFAAKTVEAQERGEALSSPN